MTATDWSEERPTADLVKQTVTMVEIAEMLDLDPDLNDKIRPPWNPNERTPSCQLYEDHFYDFSTGRWGDFIDLIQAVDPEITHSRAVHLVWTRALKSGREPGDVEVQKPRQMMDFMDEFAMYPLTGRYGIRSDGQTELIPHRDDSGVYGVKTRGPDGKRAWPGSQFTHRLYSPHGWAFGAPTESCIICEGESDSWAMDGTLGEQFDVFALPSGANAWKDHWLEDLEPYEKVWLCFDNDAAGKSALDKVTRKVGWAKAHTLKVPALMNDAREAIDAGWNPADAIRA